MTTTHFHQIDRHPNSSWAEDSYYCVECGIAIPKTQLGYALQNGAKIADGSKVRVAEIAKKQGRTRDEIAAYLPGNYVVVGTTFQSWWIAGVDNAGWTMDGYVIPRLASGLIGAKEVAR